MTLRPLGIRLVNASLTSASNLLGRQVDEGDVRLAVTASVRHLETDYGRRPFDPDGPNYGIRNPKGKRKGYGSAGKTKLDELELKPERVFGYWFDFGDDWYHRVQVERIDQAIPIVTYPRLIRRVGKSPPQHSDTEASSDEMRRQPSSRKARKRKSDVRKTNKR